MCNSVDRKTHYREGDDDEQNHLQAQTFSKSRYIKFGSYIQTGIIELSSK